MATIRTTLESFCRDRYIPNRDLRPSSARLILMRCRAFDRWSGCVAMNKIDRDLIGHWLADLAKTDSPFTVRSKRSDILSVLNWAFEERYLRQPVLRVRKVKLPKRIPTSWTLDELMRVSQAAGDLRGSFPCGNPRSIIIRAVISTVYDSCGRIGAVMAAETADWTGFKLRLRAETQKHNGEQIVLLSNTTVKLLEAINRPGKQLIPWIYDSKGTYGFSTLNDWLSRILKAAGLPHGRRDKWQKIRRTVYTEMWIKAGPQAAQIAAGHATLEMSRNYLNTERIVAASPATTLPPLFR